MLKILFQTLVLLGFPLFAVAGEPVLIHSHNDYMHQVPFYRAYSQQVDVIEADIHLEDGTGTLLVCHDPEDMYAALDLDRLYLEPLVFIFGQNGGRPWLNSERTLTLMIDLKTSLHPTIDTLICKLQRHPQVFDPAVNPYAVRIVISGSRPDADDYDNFPHFISFDGFIDVDYTPEQLERVGFISEPFWRYSKWNGDGELPATDRKVIAALLAKSHAQGKQFRFWGSPDTPVAWEAFRLMGVDIINTDRPEACTAWFRENEQQLE